MSKFLFDSNVFLQAKNLHYQFSFCGGFWDWIQAGYEGGLFYSSKKVYHELLAGNDQDDAKVWAKQMPAGFFLDDIKDASVMAHYGTIINWAVDSTHFLQAAKDEFAGENEADAYLVALALAKGFVIVTQEKSNPQKRNRILLPEAAGAFGLETVYIYDVLYQHAKSTFQLHA